MRMPGARASDPTGLHEGGRRGDGVQFRGAWATFSLVQDGRSPTGQLRLAFPAPDRKTVEGLPSGSHGSHGSRLPGQRGAGERPQCREGYFAAYVLDPDGTNVESVFRRF